MKGLKTGGRKIGSINKTTASVKEALTKAFDGTGGVEALIEWGKQHPHLFYPIWARMLPTETTVTDMRNVKDMSDEELAEERNRLLKLSR